MHQVVSKVIDMRKQSFKVFTLYLVSFMTISLSVFLLDSYLYTDAKATVLKVIGFYAPLIIYLTYMVFDLCVFHRKSDWVILNTVFSIFVPISFTILFFLACIVRNDWDWSIFLGWTSLEIFAPFAIYLLYIILIKKVLHNNLFRFLNYIVFIIIYIVLYLIYFVQTFSQFQ